MTHEKETLEKVTELRTSWANATTVKDKLTEGLKRDNIGM